MNKHFNSTATAQIKTGSGTLKGFFVATAATTPTIKLTDGIGGTPASAVKATGVYTLTDVFTDGETVTVGNRTYTMKATLSTRTVTDEVLIGVSAAISLDNIKLAVTAGAGEGTKYSTGTLVHDQVTATTNTATAQTFEALFAGTVANALSTTETAADGSFAATTLVGGLEAVTLMVNTFTPIAATYYDMGEVAFANGLHWTEGGAVDVTFFYD